jgi:feruloyl esterase
MPSRGWNRMFQAVGNGGVAGDINYDDMPLALRGGYATASTDTGHVSDDRDSTWALGHPEKVIDFGYRAIHEMTEASKRIIAAFYAQSPQWSFFECCSIECCII